MRSPRRRSRPSGDILAGDLSGRLLVLGCDGGPIRCVPGVLPHRAQGIALAADRRRAFVAVLLGQFDRPPARRYEVDLTSGSTKLLAAAISPSTSPDGSRLAYVAVGSRTSRARPPRPGRRPHPSIPFRPPPPRPESGVLLVVTAPAPPVSRGHTRVVATNVVAAAG